MAIGIMCARVRPGGIPCPGSPSQPLPTSTCPVHQPPTAPQWPARWALRLFDDALRGQALNFHTQVLHQGENYTLGCLGWLGNEPSAGCFESLSGNGECRVPVDPTPICAVVELSCTGSVDQPLTLAACSH